MGRLRDGLLEGLRGRRIEWLESRSSVSESWLSEPDRKRSFSESSIQ